MTMTDASLRHAMTTRRPAMLLHRAEALPIGISALLAVVTLLMGLRSGQAVQWSDFTPNIAACGFLLGLGLYVRARRDLPRLAAFVIAMGIFVGFANVMGLFIFSLFPLRVPVIDPLLVRIDGQLGYSWPVAVAQMADFPALGRALAVVYMSSLWQMFAVIALLAWAGRMAELHRFLLTGTLAALLTALIWWLVPSLGPATIYDIPAQTAAAIGLVVDTGYGADLLDFARNGTPLITAEIVKGAVAFPSYHTVMALLAIWFTRNTLAAVPALLVNLAMLPAILVHGAHHLSDVIGGGAVFALALVLACQLVPRRA